jgi:hypothetical protein
MDKITCPNCGAENLANARYCGRCGNQLPEVKAMPQPDQAKNAKRASDDRRFKSIVIVIGILLFCLVGYSFVRFVIKPTVKSKLMEMQAAEINRDCPVMVDEYTQLDGASVLPDNTFQFNYTLMPIEGAQLDAGKIQNYMEPGIIEHVKTSPDMKIYRDNKMTIIYYYRDQSGATIFSITVSPEMYE